MAMELNALEKDHGNRWHPPMTQEVENIRQRGLDDAVHLEPPVKRSSGGRWWVFLGAMGLSAGAGYWWGAMRLPTGDEPGGFAGRGHRDRKVVVKTARLTAVELVREARKGTLDQRQLWPNVRGFSEEEVKAAIAELKKPELGVFSSSDLPEMLFYRWGELDPVAAHAAANVLFPRGFPASRHAVIAAWIKQGGGPAAWNAVREEGEMWACTESVQGEVAEMLVASLSDLGDAAAFKEVLRLNDENSMVADTLCRARAGRACATPEARAAFLAAAATHPKPYVVGCAREFLFKEWAKRDVEAARAGLLALPISEDEKDRPRYWIDDAERDQKRNSP
jgi:hypothetical protein